MKKLFVMLWIVFTSFVSNPVCSTVSIVNPPVIDVSHQWQVINIHGPSQVGISDSIAVDLNGDGWMDVVSISIDDGHIRAYLNPKEFAPGIDLNFNQKIIEKNEQGLYRIISADLNSDGRPDLIATSIETHQIISYTQRVNGDFDKSIIAEEILLPTDVGVGDFNGDGMMDVVSISFENNEVYQHIRLANKTYKTDVIASEVLRPRKVTVSDWNQDGFIDIAVASEEDSSVQILFNKSNTAWDEQLLTDEAIGTRNLTHCDLDQNGMQDLIVSHSGENALVAYYNFGEFPFQPQVIDAAAMGVNSVLCHDLNNDGQYDLAVIYALHGNIYSYFQNQGFMPNLVANSRDGYITLAAADFTKQSQSQILTQAHFEQRNLLYHTSTANSEHVVWQDFPEGAESVRTGDINGDGVDDIVLGSFRDDTVQWYDGETFERHVIDDQVDGVNEVLVVDLDKDGFVDVLSAASYANSFYWHRNKGGNQFETILISDDEAFANALEVADIDNDNQLEVIGTTGTGDSVKWFKRNDVTFIPNLISDQYDAPNDVTAVDVNLDGLMDVVVANYFSNNIVVHLQNPLNNFENFAIANGILKAYNVLSGYFNSDDLVDFLSIDTGDFRLKGIINTGDDFDVISLYKFSSSPREIALFYNASHFKLAIITNLDGIYIYEDLRLFKIGLNEFEGTSVFINKDDILATSFTQNNLIKLSILDLIFENGFMD